MAEAIYLLCAGTSLLAAVLLFRMWRQRRTRLLLWSCLCFAGLTLNNVLLFFDLIVVPEVDLMAWRTATAFASAAVLLFGLVWEAR
jgi:hypothetical protein